MKVLIVDDQPESRRMLRGLLEHHGCMVVEACDGLEGVRKAAESVPDLIVSDALMPKMDGFQMLMELKRNDLLRNIPFVFYTGNYVGERDAELAQSLGVAAYLIKPKRPEEIWKAIASVCSGRGSGDAATVDDRHLMEYGQIVAGKLEEKIAELRTEVAERVRAEERLQTLSRTLLEKLEMERRYIARELHDEVGQLLTAIKLNLQAVERATEQNKAAEVLKDTIESTDHAIQRIRNMSLNLRPSILDDLGLSAALRWLADLTARSSGVSVTFRGDMREEAFPPEVETAAFRIVQEALTNAIKHADSSEISIELQRVRQGIFLTVRNDGRSFNTQDAFERAVKGQSFGLLGMYERASLAGGSITFRPREGGGTEIEIILPVEG